MDKSLGVWNSLEAVKVVVDVALPLVVLLLGLWVKKLGERVEEKVRFSQAEMQWRMGMFQTLNPLLNDLYCFFNYVGNWKEMAPGDIVSIKRQCDRIVLSNQFLWSGEFVAGYRQFTSLCFVEFRGKGLDALLRANREMYRTGSPKWDESWNDQFVKPEERVTRAEFSQSYNQLIALALRDLRIFG